MDETIAMSAVGGLSTPILEDVIKNGQVYTCTYFKARVAHLVPARGGYDVGSAKGVRAMKRETARKLWAGQRLGVTLGRSTEPVAYLVPISDS
jgi:hypothetical protein